MKTIASLLLGLALFFTVGCKSPALTKGVVRTSVATGVGFGVIKYPTAIPYLRAAAPVVCAAANGTNVSPAEVIAALEGSDVELEKTPEAALLMNAALSLYMTLFDEYGDDIDNLPLLQAYLEGTCEGIQLGLPPLVEQPAVIRNDFGIKPHVK